MSNLFKKTGIAILFIILGITLFITGFTTKEKGTINDFYKVYLDGKQIGIISSKDELENFINNKQEELKKKFNVSTIHAPNGLDIVPYKTYNKNFVSVKEVYKKIENIKPFTVKGYKITLETTVDSQYENKNKGDIKTLFVLNKGHFISSVKQIVDIFIGKDNYELYLKGNQVSIKEVGSIIENVSLQEKIIIKEDNISVNSNIFLNEEDLTKQLLFGTTEKQKTYIVQKGDNINDVSYNNQLNPAEFLIANPEFTSTDNLLYEGQEVVIGLINPQISIEEKKYVIEDKERQFTTQIEYDSSVYVGNETEKVKGENGLDRVSQNVTLVNGQIVSVEPLNSEELKPVVNAIVVKGSKTTSSYGGRVAVEGTWAWPTTSGYTISSYLGWRWGRLHEGIDIAGCGLGSPIYAANNGVVARSGYNGTLGNEVVIDHQNGYYTQYAHLTKIYVKTGQSVSYGDTIGSMGNTGRSTGVHLHFGLWKGGLPYRGGTLLNPFNLYK